MNKLSYLFKRDTYINSILIIVMLFQSYKIFFDYFNHLMLEKNNIEDILYLDDNK